MMKDVVCMANQDREQFGTRPAKIKKANVILCPYCYQPNILSIENESKDYDKYWDCEMCNSEILIIK